MNVLKYSVLWLIYYIPLFLLLTSYSSHGFVWYKYYITKCYSSSLFNLGPLWHFRTNYGGVLMPQTLANAINQKPFSSLGSVNKHQHIHRFNIFSDVALHQRDLEGNYWSNVPYPCCEPLLTLSQTFLKISLFSLSVSSLLSLCHLLPKLNLIWPRLIDRPASLIPNTDAERIR